MTGPTILALSLVALSACSAESPCGLPWELFRTDHEQSGKRLYDREVLLTSHVWSVEPTLHGNSWIHLSCPLLPRCLISGDASQYRGKTLLIHASGVRVYRGRATLVSCKMKDVR